MKTYKSVMNWDWLQKQSIQNYQRKNFAFCFLNDELWAVHKRRLIVRTKWQKIDSSHFEKCPCTDSTPSYLSVRTSHKFRKIRSFLHQKVRTFASEETLLSAKCPHWASPLLFANVFYGQPLIIFISSNVTFNCVCNIWWYKYNKGLSLIIVFCMPCLLTAMSPAVYWDIARALRVPLFLLSGFLADESKFWLFCE